MIEAPAGIVWPMPRKGQERAVQEHWILEVVSENVRDAMTRTKDLGNTNDLATRAKIGPSTVKRMLRGENYTLSSLGAVADALGVEPFALLVRKRQPLLRGNERHSTPTLSSTLSQQDKKRSAR